MLLPRRLSVPSARRVASCKSQWLPSMLCLGSNGTSSVLPVPICTASTFSIATSAASSVTECCSTDDLRLSGPLLVGLPAYRLTTPSFFPSPIFASMFRELSVIIASVQSSCPSFVSRLESRACNVSLAPCAASSETRPPPPRMSEGEDVADHCTSSPASPCIILSSPYWREGANPASGLQSSLSSSLSSVFRFLSGIVSVKSRTSDTPLCARPFKFDLTLSTSE